MCYKGYKHTEKTKRKMRLSTLGQVCTDVTRLKMRTARLGVQSPNKGKFGVSSCNWKGDNITSAGAHSWMKRVYGSPKYCEHCKTKTAKRFDWSNKYHTYKRLRKDWQRLCGKCHFMYDFKNNMPWITNRNNINKK
jgi:hypothetical protein